MKNVTYRRKLINFVVYLCCGVFTLLLWDNAYGTEFGGGTLTGPLTCICGFGVLSFIITVFTIFNASRLTFYAAIISILLCLPMESYLVLPGVYQRLFPGFYSVPSKKLYSLNYDAILNFTFLLVCLVYTVAGMIFESRHRKRRFPD